jgi:Asp-tRNA(Asn)/Glu-tRNA(Gln) amidotransferase A subunit family amidase
MKNITLSVDEATLHEARKYAAERNTTVNALVRAYLSSIAQREERVRQAVKRLKRLSADSELEVGPVTWTRDELYER